MSLVCLMHVRLALEGESIGGSNPQQPWSQADGGKDPSVDLLVNLLSADQPVVG